MIWFNKDAQIKSLKADVRELRTQLKFVKRYDRFFNRAMSFPDLATYLKYIKLKADLNLEIAKHVHIWEDRDTPSEMSQREREIMQRIAPIREEINKMIEACEVLSQAIP